MSEKARRLLSLARVATLATINPDGSPNLVPIVYALAGDRLVTAVDSKPKKDSNLARLRNIRRDSRVSVLAHHYAEGWQHLWWVRIEGEATIKADDEEGLAALRARYPQYGSYELLGPIISVAMDSVRVWTASAQG